MAEGNNLFHRNQDQSKLLPSLSNSSLKIVKQFMQMMNMMLYVMDISELICIKQLIFVKGEKKLSKYCKRSCKKISQVNAEPNYNVWTKTDYTAQIMY